MCIIRHGVLSVKTFTIKRSKYSEEKILDYLAWISSKYSGEKFKLDKHQMIEAAVRIGKGDTSLP